MVIPLTDAIQAMSSRIFAVLGPNTPFNPLVHDSDIMMKEEQIRSVMIALDKEHWVSRVCVGGSGAELETSLRANGYVHILFLTFPDCFPLVAKCSSPLSLLFSSFPLFSPIPYLHRSYFLPSGTCWSSNWQPGGSSRNPSTRFASSSGHLLVSTGFLLSWHDENSLLYCWCILVLKMQTTINYLIDYCVDSFILHLSLLNILLF